MLLRVLLPTVALALSLTACRTSKRAQTAAMPEDRDEDRERDRDDEFEGREVVPNYEAKVGDVTICPYSGRKFEVKPDSPRLTWKGKSWVLCSTEPMAEVQANPEKYLGKYLDETSADVDQPKDLDPPAPSDEPGD